MARFKKFIGWIGAGTNLTAQFRVAATGLVGGLQHKNLLDIWKKLQSGTDVLLYDEGDISLLEQAALDPKAPVSLKQEMGLAK